MKRYVIVGILLVLIAAGCANQPEAGMVTDYDTLVSTLEDAGLDVESLGEISQPFFDVGGQLIEVAGQEIQIFEYPDAAAAAAAAEQISEDASTIGETMVTWVDDPHVYQAGQLLVLYIGQNEQVMDALEAALGSQIAGR